MGAWLTRNRAWWYIAFYDEYVGRHINTCAGLSLLFMIPLYLYGFTVNRTTETNTNHLMYNFQYFDKRNRLCHNMVMEHFEVHKEQLEDLIIDVDKFGPRIWADIPDGRARQEIVTLDDFALIDELSGLNQFLENFMLCHNIPETVKDRIRARMITYSGAKPKDVAIQELRIKVFGSSY
jgi:hypothetical protein